MVHSAPDGYLEPGSKMAFSHDAIPEVAAVPDRILQEMGQMPSWLRVAALKRMGKRVLIVVLAIWFSYGTPVHINQPGQHLHLHDTALNGMSEQAAVLQLLSHRHTQSVPSLAAISFLPALTPSVASMVLVLVGLAGVVPFQRILTEQLVAPAHGPPRPSFS